jgi:hypothetical protein
MTTLTIRDETATGKTTGELTLDILDETITVRELIRNRVYQEVQDHNRRSEPAAAFNGLVTPRDEERALNSARTGKAGWTRREINWKRQFEVACDAFERNGFFILVDDRQAESLDEQITLRYDTKVSFVKLTPLAGG